MLLRAPSSKHTSLLASLRPFPVPPPPLLPLSFLLSLLHFLIKQQRDSFLAVSQEVKSLSNLNYFQLNNFLGLGERPSPPWVKCLPCWLSCSEAGLGANEAFDQILLIFSLSPVSAFVWSEPFFFFFFLSVINMSDYS